MVTIVTMHRTADITSVHMHELCEILTLSVGVLLIMRCITVISNAHILTLLESFQLSLTSAQILKCSPCCQLA